MAVSRIIDLTIEPTREASTAAIMPACTLRVYDSSIGGYITLAMGSNDGLSRWVEAGTRLNADQVTDLRDALNEWLRVAA